MALSVLADGSGSRAPAKDTTSRKPEGVDSRMIPYHVTN